MAAARDRTQSELVAKPSSRGVEILDGIDDVIDADGSFSPVADDTRRCVTVVSRSRSAAQGSRPRQRSEAASEPPSSKSPAAAKPALISRFSSRVPIRDPSRS